MSIKQKFNDFERAVFLGAAKIKKGHFAKVLPGLTVMLAGLRTAQVARNEAVQNLAYQAHSLLEGVRQAVQVGAVHQEVKEAYAALVRFIPHAHESLQFLVRGQRPSVPAEDEKLEFLNLVAERSIQFLF